MSMPKIIPVIAILFISCFVSVSIAAYNPSYSPIHPVDTVPFYPNGTYDESVPNPNDYISEPLGFWPVPYHELIGYLKLLAEKSDRVKLEAGGKSHENRDLLNLYIGSPENIARLDEIKKTSATFADPRNKINPDGLIEKMPAIAWIGCSIHGDEISGVDAGLRLAYQLAAGTDSATMHLLDNILIIIDPSENPDGRERYLSMLASYRSNVPNYDRHAQQHQGVWPYGRGNHYLFDLNRDWIYLSQPETKHRTKTILTWNPHLVIDAHEMGTNATFLFSPPRQPINYNTPDNIYKWWDIFKVDQGNAFDKNGWPYYTGEWNEQWYPGYASTWPTFFGTIGILYEQSGVDGTFVQQKNGYLMTYHESVNHQFTSSIANLHSLANNKKEILKDFRTTRQGIIDKGLKSNLSYLVVPRTDDIKMKRFVESLTGQNIRVQQAEADFTVAAAKDIFLKEHKSKKFPKGTIIINTAQVQGSLAKAILEFDPHFKLQFLNDERKEIEKYGGTKMYETTTWSVPLAYNLDAYETTSSFNVNTKEITTFDLLQGKLHNKDAQYGFIIDMVGEKTYLALAKLFENHILVYAAEKPFKLEGRSYKAGALVIRHRGNYSDVVPKLEKISNDIGINIYGINTGLATEGSHLGADTYQLLTEPRIALLSGNSISTTSFGSLWFALDQEMQLPHSLINVQSVSYTDISKYNILIIPSSWGNSLGRVIGKGGKSAIDKWVSDGGTLITVGAGSIWAADSSNGLSRVALKRQALDDLDSYSKHLEKMQAAETPVVDTMQLYHPDKVPANDTKESAEKSAAPKDIKELDEWQRKFMPRGVFFKAELDLEHWLNFGMTKEIPVSLYTSYALLAKSPVKTAALLTTDENSLRLSGLLWPEARTRWAGSTYLTQERHGSGQIIMFASDPHFRAYYHGTRQMFFNAIMFGPGFNGSFDSPYQNE
ncbi:MAG: hypothetical protein DWP97_12230 [Calditrichaeota bacterium]|nr:MAG: hypothetical protein DWP97_12230 [Calditrichota bacterium]